MQSLSGNDIGPNMTQGNVYRATAPPPQIVAFAPGQPLSFEFAGISPFRAQTWDQTMDTPNASGISAILQPPYTSDQGLHGFDAPDAHLFAQSGRFVAPDANAPYAATIAMPSRAEPRPNLNSPSFHLPSGLDVNSAVLHSGSTRGQVSNYDCPPLQNFSISPNYAPTTSSSGPGLHQVQFNCPWSQAAPTDPGSSNVLFSTGCSTAPTQIFGRSLAPGFSDSAPAGGAQHIGQQLCSDQDERNHPSLPGSDPDQGQVHYAETPALAQDPVAAADAPGIRESLSSSHHEQPSVSSSGPDLRQEQVGHSDILATPIEQAFNDETRSPKSSQIFDRSLDQESSRLVFTPQSQDFGRRPQQKGRKRLRSSTPESEQHKRRRRLASPFTPRVRRKTSTTIVDHIFADIKRLDVFSSDPFHWSVEFVLFALTSPMSIDLEVPTTSDASLPPCKELREFIYRHHIDGYNLLLCTDSIAMCCCGITDPGHQQALGDYIVRFRRRSPAYQSYCYDKQIPLNFSPERLIDAVGLEHVIERELKDYFCSAKKAMRHVRLEEGMVYSMHYPIGTIEVRQGEDGQLAYSLCKIDEVKQ